MEKNRQNNEEIDVFELFRYIGRGFEKLGNTLLRFFNFLMRNIIIIGILIVVGLFVGYLLDSNLPEKRKTTATVVSNFDSAGYLYKSVDEIGSLLDNENEAFLKKIGLSEEEAAKLSMEIQPITKVLEITEDEKAFFEILEDSEIMADDEKKEMLKRTYSYHEISLFHTEDLDGRKILEKLVQYIRENPFFVEMAKESNKDIQHRIESNYYVLAQIDSLLGNYTKLIGTGGEVGKNLIYSENSLNLAGLLNSRLELQQETTNLLIEKVENTAFLKIVDLGHPQDLEKAGIFSKNIILIPTVLFGLFLLLFAFFALRSKGKVLEQKN